MAYDQRRLAEPLEDNAGCKFLLTFEDLQGYPRLRSIATWPGEPDIGPDPRLLVSYDDDASGTLDMVSNGKGTLSWSNTASQAHWHRAMNTTDTPPAAKSRAPAATTATRGTIATWTRKRSSTDNPFFKSPVQYRIKWWTHKIAFPVSTPLISVTPAERSSPCSMLTSL
ncbi:hypothetical protein [Massilia aquatica]|uniref:Uncharacterized protein n=1 Tax=Massilia aquatica TaxID=2609000 RepID=A0ABX0M6V3_9BURK|nr:hypothetical protein [Massilia aquatica]NHZ42950.1 hypothetical protein [Massilia aquatica]